MLATILILYPLKTPENLWFSGVFRGYKMGTSDRNGLNEFKRTNELIFSNNLRLSDDFRENRS